MCLVLRQPARQVCAQTRVRGGSEGDSTESSARFHFVAVALTVPVSLGASEMSADKPGPDAALQMLKDGNQRFHAGKAARPHADGKRLALADTVDQGEYAYATILACSDSRVPVEIIFDAGIMDLFVVRVAGNVCDTDEIGTIEYGLGHVHTPVVVILGHTRCGAVTAVTHALEGKGAPLERNIPALVEKIAPAVESAAKKHSESHDDAIIPYAIEENVWHGIRNLFMESPVSRDYVKQGKAKVVGAIYDLATGKIRWLPEETVMEILEMVEESPDKQTAPFATE